MQITKFDNALRDRTRKFRKESEARCSHEITSPKASHVHKAFFELYKDQSHMLRQALSWTYALVREPIHLFDGELLVGQHYRAEAGPCGYGRDPLWGNNDGFQEYRERLRQEIPEIFRMAGFEDFDGEQLPNCWVASLVSGPGHIGWRWDWIVESGIEGMFKRIDKAYAQVDDKGREVLEAMRICLQGVLDMNARHLKALREKLNNSDRETVSEIERKISICECVPRYGARNFREAIQAFHITYLATMFENPYGGNGPGRLDYFLWPYLEKDLEKGEETLESTRLLIDELFIRFHERYRWSMDGAVETITVAGSHPDGASAANPLSKIMIESIASLNITHPSVYIRVPEKAPEWLLELATLDIIHGGNRAQILNDQTIVEAMTRDGRMNKEDAYMYMCGGCMEISSQGKNGDLLFTEFFNVGKVLEFVLTGGECLINHKRLMPHLDKTLRDYDTFEQLYDAFWAELRRCLTTTFKKMDIRSEHDVKFRPTYLISSQIEDCVRRGRVINDGGAVYEDYGSTPLGIPNVGDSLFAIKKAVFVDKFIEKEELLVMLKQNFKDAGTTCERLRKLPKYGQGDHEADAMTNKVLTDICSIYDSYTNRWGGKVKPMIMTFMQAAPVGATLGATADGRLSGTPIAQGVTPQSASMSHGITTAMLSANSLNIDFFSGGASHMWDLDQSFSTPEIVGNLIKTFFKTGGQMFQGNVTDIETLKKAMDAPAEYSNMIVRVGGFSAKFTSLPKNCQNELINRVRHRV